MPQDLTRVWSGRWLPEDATPHQKVALCILSLHVHAPPLWLNNHCLSLSLSLSLSLRYNDTIWWQRSGSTLAQVMADCVMAPSHYLNQCWPAINLCTMNCMGVHELNLYHINWLVQERRNSIANALELRLSCTNPSICSCIAFIKIHPFLPGTNE